MRASPLRFNVNKTTFKKWAERKVNAGGNEGWVGTAEPPQSFDPQPVQLLRRGGRSIILSFKMVSSYVVHTYSIE
jgi:hypothetical protein